jgi:hypothetical protein
MGVDDSDPGKFLLIAWGVVIIALVVEGIWLFIKLKRK